MEVTSKKNYEEPSDSRRRHTGLFPGACQTRHVPWTIQGLCWFKSLRRSCAFYLFIRAPPNLISLRSADCAPQKFDPALIARFRAVMLRSFVMVDPTTPPAS